MEIILKFCLWGEVEQFKYIYKSERICTNSYLKIIMGGEEEENGESWKVISLKSFCGGRE